MRALCVCVCVRKRFASFFFLLEHRSLDIRWPSLLFPPSRVLFFSLLQMEWNFSIPPLSTPLTLALQHLHTRATGHIIVIIYAHSHMNIKKYKLTSTSCYANKCACTVVSRILWRSRDENLRRVSVLTSCWMENFLLLLGSWIKIDGFVVLKILRV